MKNPEAVVALACGINPDGSLDVDPKSSVELALENYHASGARWLILSGGLSYKADFRPPISEAQAMKDYAVSFGAEPDKILIEADSKDTFGNAYFTKINLLKPLAITKLLIIAGPNHSRDRLDYIFGKVLGQDYDYDFKMHEVNRPVEAAREKASEETLEVMFAGVPDGDDAAIYQRMRERHPAYKT